MQKFASACLFVTLGAAATCFVGCGDDEIVLGLPLGGTAGFDELVGGAGGRGGAGGSGNLGGAGGVDADAMAPGPGGSGPDASRSCSNNLECEDGNPCTANFCDPNGACASTPAALGTSCGDTSESACSAPDTCDGAGACAPNHVALGTACGSPLDDACTNPDSCDGAGACAPNHAALGTACGTATDDACTDPDSCDGAGACVPNHAAVGTACGSPLDDECTNPDGCDGAGVCSPNNAANGAACAIGRCTAGVCDCAQTRVAGVPFNTTWSTATGAIDFFDPSPSCVDNGDNDADFIVVFTAPSAATYRFSANSDDDPLIAVLDGSCTQVELDCDDDSGTGLNARLDLALTAGQVVSVVVGERDDATGGTGTLSIELAP